MSEIIPILEEKFVIPSYFVDENAQMTVSCLFRILQEMSNKAVELLLKRIESGNNEDPMEIALGTKLQKGNSIKQL